jgi:AcrR family transcriptional regulator
MSSTPISPPRGTKRDRTRNRLLVATQELLRERSAGSLSIRDVSQRADVSHATFYNYYESVEALLDNLAALFAFTHAQSLAVLTQGVERMDEVFAISTRQTLRFLAESPEYGHYLFDVGLRIDHFANGMRLHLDGDLRRGLETGVFAVDDIELTLALVTGSLLGVALGLHRGELTAAAIEPTTERLLMGLGVSADQARTLVQMKVAFLPAPRPPLDWPLFDG